MPISIKHLETPNISTTYSFIYVAQYQKVLGSTSETIPIDSLLIQHTFLNSLVWIEKNFGYYIFDSLKQCIDDQYVETKMPANYSFCHIRNKFA